MRLLLISGSGLALVFAWILWSNQVSIWEQAAALLFASAGLLMLWAAFTPDAADDECLQDPTEDWGGPTEDWGDPTETEEDR